MSWNTRRCNVCEKLTRCPSQKLAYCDNCKPSMPKELKKLLEKLELKMNKK